VPQPRNKALCLTYCLQPSLRQAEDRLTLAITSDDVHDVMQWLMLHDIFVGETRYVSRRHW